MFIKNCWYVAAWDHELPRQGTGLLQRTILSESILMYRTSDGQVVALSNKCCHRHAPLSLGRREGDCIRCMYHGLKYDRHGQCVEIPGQTVIPSHMRVRNYPVVESKRWVWIWMGDPAQADAARIPDTFSLDHADWRMKPGYMRYRANHLLISDNLLDFSHLSYVHEGTLGGSPEIAQTRPKMERLERGVRVRREVSNIVPAPYHQRLAQFSGPVDRWFVYDYLIPGVLLMESGVRATDPRARETEKTLNFHSCQAITPESAAATHYFFASAHQPWLPAEATEHIYQSVIAAFHEDQRMIEAQQQLIDTTAPTDMRPLLSDAALGQFRLLMTRALESETLPS
ncbi:MAG TPA: aromatic ring-hydroxylating dioxygenase subunit alpha [Steroidobacteraceae bacterium]|nr:aromatic ring-hydroxylating dioxygenase subunit alpha [Steroidobacteraceae bacterium]